jgi:uncharacterized protein (TIGR02246 family)
MKRRTLLAAVPFAALPASANEKEVMEGMNKYAAAMAAKDAKALDEVFHDGLMYSHSSCKLENKNQAMEAVVKGDTAYDVQFKQQSVLVFGNTAAVRGDVDIITARGGQKTVNKLNVLYVWTKEKGKWRMAARQATLCAA